MNKNLIKKQYRKDRINSVISKMKNQYGNVDFKLVDFIDELNDNGFFTNISDYNIDYMLETNNCSGIFKSKNLTIGFDWTLSGQTRIGIDPSFCFNKIGDCSILAYFPMSKREFNRFKKLFSLLIARDKLSLQTKYWYKVAKTSWCGNYALFGR